MLLERGGINPDKRNRDGLTPLLCAAATVPGSSSVTQNVHHIHSCCLFLAVNLLCISVYLFIFHGSFSPLLRSRREC